MKILHLAIIAVLIVVGVCNTVFALGESQTCDKTILPHNWPSSHIYITDTNGNLPYVPLTYHTAVFHDDDEWNTSSQSRTIHVVLTIQDKYSGQQVFNQTQSLQMQPCSGPESANWRFVPIQVSDYIATVSDARGSVSMSFMSMLGTTQSQTVSLPLEQLRFGVDSHNVICRQDLQLVIKSEDGSPACVKPDTANILIKSGWAEPITSGISQTNLVSNQTVEIVSVQSVSSLTNPGGPPIQLTLKNIGVTPITSLKATLVLNNDYNFDFKNVTQSNPLTSGDSMSETRILIGAGFRTDLTYPITISGITNNTPFTYTENIHMP